MGTLGTIRKETQMNIVLLACFLPLAIIFIIIKLSVWLSGIYTEEKYVESESRREHGPYLEKAYEDVDREAEEREGF